MTWRVTVDAELCIGSGVCVGTAPGRFRFDGSLRSNPVSEQAEPDDQIRNAALSCPVEAIQLTDAATGEPVALDD